MRNGSLNNFLWISDLHLDQVDNKYKFRLFDKISKRNKPILFTGDLGTSETNKVYFEQLLNSCNQDIYFIPGNTDYYYSSIEETDKYLESLPIKLLTKLQPQIFDNLAIIGSVTWFNSCGQSNLESRDFIYIEEFKSNDWKENFNNLIEIELKNFESKLYSIPDYVENIIILSHPVLWKTMNYWKSEVGKFFINEKAGAIIDKYSMEYPDKNILVLSGHTHKKSSYRRYGVVSYSPMIDVHKPNIIAEIGGDLTIWWNY